MSSDFQKRLVAPEPVNNSVHQRPEIQTGSALESAFPDCQLTPVSLRKKLARSDITLDIALDLLLPEFGARRRHPKQMTVVAVPEATMDENGRAITWQHNIGLSGHVFRVKTKPKPGRRQRLANNQLG